MLELKNISFEVSSENEKQIDIIRDLSMTVKDGTFVVITGPNGGGKSTMARLIAGIEKPNTGQILLDGVDVTEEGVTERARRGISFAFQQPVRFKGIRVSDLLRLAAGEGYSAAGACSAGAAVAAGAAAGAWAKDIAERARTLRIPVSLRFI